MGDEAKDSKEGVAEQEPLLRGLSRAHSARYGTVEPHKDRAALPDLGCWPKARSGGRTLGRRNWLPLKRYKCNSYRLT